MIRKKISAKKHGELVLALESARTRLAVAIASESKSTSLSRRRYYLETADRTRRFVRELRKAEPDFPREGQDFMNALEALQQLPNKAEALQLCRILGEIVTCLSR